MRFKLLHSIKVRITVIVLSILVLVMTILLVSNYFFAENYYVNRKSSRIQKVYQDMGGILYRDGKQALITAAGRYGEDHNLQIVIADSNFQCLYDNRSQFTGGSFDNAWVNYKEDRELFSAGAKPHIIRGSGKNDKVVLYGILEEPENLYYVAIRASVRAIRADMQGINSLMFYLSAAALAIGGVITYFSVRKITGPIEEIDQAAQRVSELDFSGRATEGLSCDELGRLAKNINCMSKNLEGTINELKKANEILAMDNQYKERLNEERKEFIANISHELKTPLAVMEGYAEMLRNNVEGIDKNYYCDVILDETKQMETLVKKLLDLSSLEKDIANIMLRRLDASDFVRKIIKKSEPLFREKEINCCIICDKTYIVMADAFYLERALMNYITNGVSHTGVKGTISVTLEEGEEGIRIAVYNEGPGIEEGKLEHIWESFYRLEPARTRREEGCVGLGLYIVSRIMQGLGGRYGVRNMERGVEFWIELDKAQ